MVADDCELQGTEWGDYPNCFVIHHEPNGATDLIWDQYHYVVDLANPVFSALIVWESLEQPDFTWEWETKS